MDSLIIKTTDYTSYKKPDRTTVYFNGGKKDIDKDDYKILLSLLLCSPKVKEMFAFSCDASNSLVQDKPFWDYYLDKKQDKKVRRPNSDLFDSYENYNYNKKDDDYKNCEFIITGVKGFAGVIRNEIDWNGKKYDVTLEVRSRFDEENKPWFLATMLSQFITGEQRISTSNEVWKGDIEIFGFLSAVLFQNLLKRAYESGIYKTYVRIEHNDEKLRGTIDIARHLRLNAGRNDAVIAYNTREHSYDNMLNHLIIITWDYLKRRYSGICEQIEKDTEFLRAVKNIRGFIGGKRAELSRCVKDCQHSITGPYYTDYEELRKLCLIILNDEANANIFSGNSDRNVCGIAIYIPDLWEKYLERAIRQQLPQDITLSVQDDLNVVKDKSIFSGDRLKNLIDKQVFIENYYKQEYNKHFCHIYPDFVFKSADKPFYILDAKFKIYKKEDNTNIEDDVKKLKRDMLFFSKRHYGCAFPLSPIKGGLIMPNSEANEIEFLSSYTDHYINLYFIKVPSAEKNNDYNKWLKEFLERTKEGLQPLRDLLNDFKTNLDMEQELINKYYEEKVNSKI